MTIDGTYYIHREKEEEEDTHCVCCGILFGKNTHHRSGSGWHTHISIYDYVQYMFVSCDLINGGDGELNEFENESHERENRWFKPT